MTDPDAPFAGERRLQGDLRRLGRQVARHLAAPAADPAQRLALIDDLVDLCRRLRATQAGLAPLLRRSAVVRTAVSAYGRTGALRR